MMKYLSAKQLQDQTTISLKTWLMWAKERRVPSYKVGGRILFKENEIEAFIDSGSTQVVVSDTEVTKLVDRIIKKSEDADRNGQKTPVKGVGDV